ncbi:MAG: GTPase ObgE [Anaerolineae bacterium]
MFYDQITITVHGGDGGNGVVAFRREKFIPFGGPSGGNGGGGGSVYLRANSRINTLIAFSRVRRFKAKDGGHGSSKSQQGRGGEDLYIDVPLGTQVVDLASREVLGDLAVEGQTLLVARGGRGGRGNEVFKTAARHTPKFAERGEPGQMREIVLELKLIADVGLLGKPNAGKSTLLAAVSAAHPKIADYPFTTLSPMLGMVERDGRSFVMADIPGLIENAHAGAGLGIQFLRHVERTRLLVHLVDGTSADPLADYRSINTELAFYSQELAAKPQIVVLTKLDVTEAREAFEKFSQALAGSTGAVLGISAVTGEGIDALLEAIFTRLAELPRAFPEPGEVVLTPKPVEDKQYRILREGDGVYRVKGEEIERLAIMTDWSSDESIERFERILKARGISDALIGAGVELGDTVYFGAIELEWR